MGSVDHSSLRQATAAPAPIEELEPGPEQNRYHVELQPRAGLYRHHAGPHVANRAQLEIALMRRVKHRATRLTWDYQREGAGRTMMRNSPDDASLAWL